MPTYERSTRVRAPLSEVWSFHSRVDGLKKLTPGSANLRVDALRGPDGEELSPDALLVEGTELDLSVRPLGVGPRQSFSSRIVARRERPGVAWFRDEMVDGPFREWVHTHLFYADGEYTLLRDHVRYRFPLGALGDAVGPAGAVGFEAVFRDRHRRTRALLE